ARLKKDSWDIHGLIAQMQRAHEESAMKSRRSIANWKKKVDAIRRGETVTTRMPGWIDVANVVRAGTRLVSADRVLNPEKTAWVRKMVGWKLGKEVTQKGQLKKPSEPFE